jgi:hypothetical protein
MANKYTVSVPELQDEERQRKVDYYDRMIANQGDDTRLTQAEDVAVSDRSQPEPAFVRPKVSRGKRILGSFLESTSGGHRIGQRMLKEEPAREDFDLAVQARARRNVRDQQNVNTLTNQYNRQSNEAFKLTRQQQLIGKGEEEIGLAGARMETERAKQDLYRAQSQKALNPTYKATKPGSLIFGEQTGTVTQPGDPNTYGKSSGSRTSVFGTFNPGQGIYNRESGVVQTPANPAAVRATKAPGGAGGAALSGKGLQVETNKSRALLGQKKSYDSRRDAIEKRWEGFDTSSPTRPDGTPNPYSGARERDLEELNKWDSQKKNLIQRSYQNELSRIGQTPDNFEYGATTENMDVTGQADEAAMTPASGEDVDVESLRQELGPGEILLFDPESGRHFAAPEAREDEFLAEGYEKR